MAKFKPLFPPCKPRFAVYYRFGVNGRLWYMVPFDDYEKAKEFHKNQGEYAKTSDCLLYKGHWTNGQCDPRELCFVNFPSPTASNMMVIPVHGYDAALTQAQRWLETEPQTYVMRPF